MTHPRAFRPAESHGRVAAQGFVAAACPTTGKIAYRSKAFAKESARRLNARGLNRGRPYRCRFCDLWHLTTQKRRDP